GLQNVMVREKVGPKAGERHKYSITAYFHSPGETIMASGESWSFLEAIDEICEKLERQIMGKGRFSRKDKGVRP
ncbi:MAG: HPF/RaiA family ribosome-associated protein, partial [Candidatus Methanomethylicus sp.]|nr:HPF/RaiA family ribosome-associated protein [Candidatus Methanomethylicus sp.]